MEWRDKAVKETKLLIVVDMQNDFIDGSLGTPEAQAIVPKVIEKIKSWDGNIICTMDTHQMDYLTTAEGKKLPMAHCIKFTDGWYITKDIRTALLTKENITEIEKPTFGSKDLFIRLQNAIDGMSTVYPINFTEIQLIGLCTDICVVSNALLAKAFFPEVPIIVDASCCAGTTPENHKAALQVMKCCQIDVINEEGNND